MSKPTESEEMQRMRDYWLERLPEEDAYQAESQWLDDEEKVARLETAREDLIDDSLNGELDAGERHAFENFFLATPANLEAVALAKAFRRLIDREAVAAFDAEAIESVSSKSLRQRFGEMLGYFRTFSPVMLTGLASLLIFVMLGIWLVSRQSGPANPQIARVENVNTAIQLPTNTDVPDRTPQDTLIDQPTDTLAKNNVQKPPKTNPRRESTPIERTKKSPVEPERKPPVEILDRNQILMGESSGQGCTLEIKNESNTVRIKLMKGEKPTAVEIKLAGEQTPIEILPVQLKAGQKVMTVTFSGQKLEAGKEYRFTLLEGDRRPRSSVCRVSRSNP